jgi:hypothetical protein
MRPSSPLLDSVRDLFEGQDQLAKDFTKTFYFPKDNSEPVPNIFDVTFIVGQGKVKTKLHGVRAILGVRSRLVQFIIISPKLMNFFAFICTFNFQSLSRNAVWNFDRIWFTSGKSF